MAVSIALGACNSNSKPKAVSDSVTKTTVTVNGQKDSVINNPRKNYGNASIAEPCVRCIILAIQADSNYNTIAGTQDADYVINYVKSVLPQDTITETKSTNAIRVDIVDKNAHSKKIATYIYDNTAAKLFIADKSSANSLITVMVDDNLLKRIRNSCYWGVSSGK